MHFRFGVWRGKSSKYRGKSKTVTSFLGAETKMTWIEVEIEIELEGHSIRMNPLTRPKIGSQHVDNMLLFFLLTPYL